MKPQKITAKPQRGLVTTRFETTSWLFLPQQIFNSTVLKTVIVLFVFQLIYMQRIDMNDMFSDILRESDGEWSRWDQTRLDSVSESKNNEPIRSGADRCLLHLQFKGSS